MRGYSPAKFHLRSRSPAENSYRYMIEQNVPGIFDNSNS